MKRILISLVAVLVCVQSAYAGTCETSLMPAFTAAQATQICKITGSAINHSLIPSADNTYDLGSSSFGWRTAYVDTSVVTPLVNHATSLALGIAGTAEATVTNDTLTFSGAAASIVGGATSLTVGSSGSTIIRADADANRLFTFDAGSDTALALTFGDGGTTAAQVLDVRAATADADDDGALCLGGGGGCASGSNGYARGAVVAAYGNEHATLAGVALIQGGGVVGADVIVRSEDDFIFEDNTGADKAVLTDTGVLTTTAGITATTGNITSTAGSFVASTSGGTLHLQEATAGAKCMGTATANGVTAVTVATTCVLTASRIFISRTSAVAAGVTEPGCWATNIINATSFDLDCNDAAEDSTFNWFIINEAA